MDIDLLKIKAPTGTKLNCKGWAQEAAYRMLLNNLDAEVAEKPEELIVYGGSGKAARNKEALIGILESLKKLENDETLLVQSGKAVGVIKTHTDAPRVMIANSNLVGKWANWEYFRELEKKGLIMYGQMTAGSWIYIGTQGILQGTYETFAELARQHYDGSMKGKIVLSGGLGGMGGAQPLSVTMNEGIGIFVEIDKERILRRVEHKYLDEWTDSVNDAIARAKAAAKEGRALSIGLLGNTANILPEMLEKGFIPDCLTDQTSSHDMLNGYVPNGMSYEAALKLRKDNPDEYIKLSKAACVKHVQAMLDMQKAGAVTFDYGNNIRQVAFNEGLENAFDFPGFVPAYIRPLFCEGKGPFRWVALSGDPEDIYTTDRELMKLFPEDESLKRWLKMAQEKVHFQGLPSRICWLGYGERAKAGALFNRLVKEGKIKAPIVIGRDHLDGGSVASPNRETEAMKDGSDAIADWPVLNLLANAVNGATWVSYHHGGGVGIGYSLHAGMVIMADGTDEAAARLERVLTADPGTALFRHADAGYEKAINVAKERGAKIPGVTW